MALTPEEARKIDIEVAERVMGISVKPYPPEAPVYWNVYGQKTLEVLPYSTSIEAAWEVVEVVNRLNKYTRDFWTHRYCRNVESNDWWWAACFSKDSADHSNDFWAEADTAPHAICLAALKAVGSLPTRDINAELETELARSCKHCGKRVSALGPWHDRGDCLKMVGHE